MPNAWPRKVAKQPFESLIRKAVESNSEDENYKRDDDRGNRKGLQQVASDNQEQMKMKRNITVRAKVPTPVRELEVTSRI